MTTPAAVPDSVFVDTNILVYAAISTAPFHAEAFGHLDAFRRAGAELWISRQILCEYIATLSRPQPFTPPLPAATLIADVHMLATRFRIAEDGPTVTAQLLGLLATIPVGGRQVHDANIVATMRAHGLSRLLTHNTADFARFAAMIQVEPMTAAP